MFKPELWQGHDEYRTIVTTVGHKLSRNNPKHSFDSCEEERQKLLNPNLTRLLNTSWAFIQKAAGLQSTRHRSFAPPSFLSCFSIKRRPAQALPYGSGVFFRNPFPWLSSLAVLPSKNCRLLVLTMIL